MRRTVGSHLRLSHIKFFLFYAGQFLTLNLNRGAIRLLGVCQALPELAWSISAFPSLSRRLPAGLPVHHSPQVQWVLPP